LFALRGAWLTSLFGVVLLAELPVVIEPWGSRSSSIRGRESLR